MMYFRLRQDLLNKDIIIPWKDARLSTVENAFGSPMVQVETTHSMVVYSDDGRTMVELKRHLLDIESLSGEVGQICIELDDELYVYKEWDYRP